MPSRNRPRKPDEKFQRRLKLVELRKQKVAEKNKALRSRFPNSELQGHYRSLAKNLHLKNARGIRTDLTYIKSAVDSFNDCCIELAKLVRSGERLGANMETHKALLGGFFRKY